jgi:transposase
VAVDGTGRKLAERTVATTPAGHLEVLRWARRWRERTWALEDCRHLTRRLERDLLAAGERIVRSNREPGKSDPIDALSVARAALREPDLPSARLDGVERDLRLLVDHREDLVADRTGHQERLRWFLVELGITEPPARSLDRAMVLDRLEAELAERTEPVARFARDLLIRIRDLTRAIDGLEREIRVLAARVAPSLLALTGCGHLTAAKLVGQTAGIGRFRSRAAFARHNGTAPVPVWSGNTVRHRLNRGGDRQLNVALHRIAITQLQREGPGRAYLTKRMAAGDTKTEAIRALRRRLSDEVFRRLMIDELDRTRALTALTAAAA